MVFAQITEAAEPFLEDTVGLVLEDSVRYVTYHTNISILLHSKHAASAWNQNGYDRVSGLMKVCDVH